MTITEEQFDSHDCKKGIESGCLACKEYMEQIEKAEIYAYEDYSADRKRFNSEAEYLQWCGLL